VSQSDEPTTAARLDSLTSLDADQRQALYEDLAVEFELAEGKKDADAMQTALTGLEKLDMYEQLVEQIEEAAAPAEKASESAEGSDTEDEKSSESEDEKSEDTEKPAEDEKSEDEDEKAKSDTEVEGDTVATAEGDDVQPEATAEGANTESEEKAMAASAVESTDELKPVTASSGTSVAVTAFRPNGERYADTNEIANVMSDMVQSMVGRTGGDGSKALVASLKAKIDESRILAPTDFIANSAKIDAQFAPQALTASGGFCAPLPVNYDIFGVGSTARPVRDSLPTFGATRGGIRYIAPPVLGSYTNALSVWTAANDANPTSPTTKPVLKVNCASELTATVDAITLSLEFGNLLTRAFPELVQRHNQLALVEHARFAEKALLAKISAVSTKVTTTKNLGTARDLLVSITRAMAAYRNRHRIPRPVQLRGIFPEWVRDAVREDIATNMAQGVKDIAITDTQVDAWFANRGLRPTWHMDDTFAAQAGAGAELNDFPATIKYWLFTEGTLLFLDGGTLDLGVIRDADLVSTNDYVTFVETFEGLAKVGIEVLEVTATTSLGLPPVEVTP
jgi:hypothetical protein